METSFSNHPSLAAGPADANAGPAALISIPGQIEATGAPPLLQVNPEDSSDFWLDDRPPLPRPPECCGAPFNAVRGCGCGTEAVRAHCDDRMCGEEYCQRKIRDRRARKIRRRLEGGMQTLREVLEILGEPSRVALIYSVFTVPPRLRMAATSKKTWKSWIDRLIRFLKKDLDLCFAVERSDPAGKCDLAKASPFPCTCQKCTTWHPHVNLLWVRKDGQGWIDDDKRALISANWKRITGEHPENPIDVHHEYAIPGRSEKDDAKLGHWASYQGRAWPFWERPELAYHTRVKWFGKCPKTPDDDNDGSCAECGLEIAVLRVGSREEADRLAAFGYAYVLQECHARRDELRRQGRQRRKTTGILDITEGIRRGLVDVVGQMDLKEVTR